MIYFKFKDPFNVDNQRNRTSSKSSIIERFLCFLIPKGNPDFDDQLYDDVRTWYIEYDDAEEYTNREVGMDGEGNVIVKAPYRENCGYWTDNNLTLPNYLSRFDIVYISEEEFDALWEQLII